jgi:hypothetical protein
MTVAIDDRLRREGCHNARRFMAKNQGRLQDEVAVAAVIVIM